MARHALVIINSLTVLRLRDGKDSVANRRGLAQQAQDNYESQRHGSVKRTHADLLSLDNHRRIPLRHLAAGLDLGHHLHRRDVHHGHTIRTR